MALCGNAIETKHIKSRIQFVNKEIKTLKIAVDSLLENSISQNTLLIAKDKFMPANQLSVLDKRALASPIFLPGSSPTPPNNNKTSKQKNSTNNTADKRKDDDVSPTSDAKSVDDSSTTSSYSDLNNNYNNYPSSNYMPVTQSNSLTLTPSDIYTYDISSSGTNPFSDLAKKNNSLSVKINTAMSFTGVKICNNTYDACSNTIPISNKHVYIK